MNIHTYEISYWKPPANVYIGPALYVGKPGVNDTDEDSGVIVVSALDTAQKRGCKGE